MLDMPTAANRNDQRQATTYEGGCHCGAVRFRVHFGVADAHEALDCNCSICKKKGFLHLIVPSARFTLLAGQESLATYTFGTHVAKHTFCSHCGVKAFYTPRSHPEGVSVNARCIDSDTVASMSISPFDGRHWESARDGLRGPDET